MSTTLVGSPLRTLAGDVVPVTGRWDLDPDRTAITLVGRRLIGTTVRARFTGVAGTVVIGDDPGDSLVEVSVPLASVSTGTPGSDVRPFSAELLAWAGVPVVTFRSTFVSWEGGPEAVVEGDLTIDKVKRPVLLDVEFLGAATDRRGDQRAALHASTDLDRREWGGARNVAREVVDGLISRRLRIDISLEMVHEPREDHRRSTPATTWSESSPTPT